eukprot:Rhum_TRINITY_DN3444_c0_g1::Rhum_TRINITY_DN3444_c0_g1_i1::g.10662::m.10662
MAHSLANLIVCLFLAAAALQTSRLLLHVAFDASNHELSSVLPTGHLPLDASSAAAAAGVAAVGKDPTDPNTTSGAAAEPDGAERCAAYAARRLARDRGRNGSAALGFRLSVTEPLESAGRCVWRLRRRENLQQEEDRHLPEREVASFLRVELPGGDEVDVSQTPHTPLSVEGVRGVLREGGGPDMPVVRWTQRFRGCRLCGYSCSGFHILPRTPKEQFAYPVVRRKALQAKVIVSPEKIVASAPKNQFRLYVYGADRNLEGALTAYFQGWSTSISRGRLLSQTCRSVVTRPTFFFRRRSVATLAQTNVAHWLHDVLFPMFMTIYNHVGDPQSADFAVVPDEGDATHALWSEYWAVGEIGQRLLSTLVPYRSRVQLGAGMCFRHAIFDCPASDSMRPIAPFQRWLAAAKRLSFAPLSVPSPVSASGAAGAALRLTLLMRCPGGSRYLAGHEEMRRVARQEGFVVATPPPVPIFLQMTALVTVLQRTHVLAGVHGSELAPMLFMPNGSVVVEIVPQEFRYHDAWYVRQAAASGLHLLRLTPFATTYTMYGEGHGRVCGRHFYKYEKKVLEEPNDEASYRQLASNVTLSARTWQATLTLAKDLLYKQAR